MTCEEALPLISGHIDGENTPEEEAQLQSHLEQCPQCRQILQAFLEISSGIASLEAEAPADLQEQVMAAIRAEKPVKRKMRNHWTGIAIAAALVVVIGAGVMTLPQFQMKQETAAEPALARSVGDTADTAAEVPAASVEYGAAADMVVAENDAAFFAQDTVVEVDPQSLAEERQADVAVTHELLPEMEVCTCETLEDGSLLYCLESADGAVNLSRIYGVELYQPASYGEAAVSYALLLP